MCPEILDSAAMRTLINKAIVILILRAIRIMWRSRSLIMRNFDNGRVDNQQSLLLKRVDRLIEAAKQLCTRTFVLMVPAVS